MKEKILLAGGLSVLMLLAACGRGSEGNNTGPVVQRPGATSTGESTASSTNSGVRCWLDKLNGETVAARRTDVVLPAAKPFAIEGWLVDGTHHSAQSMQWLLTPVAGGGDAHSFTAVTSVVRVDVARALHSDYAKDSGFTVKGSTDQILPGRYKATAQGKSGTGDFECDLKVVFNIPKSG